MTEIVRLPEPARARFAWFLPLVFAAGAALGSLWPGHGGQLFVIGSLAGVWACFLVSSGTDPVGWLLPTLLGGLPVVWLLGRLLDRLRADGRLFAIAMAIVAGLAGYVLLQGYGDLDRALEHHGGIAGYTICAVQLGSYGATLLLLAIEAGRGGAA